mmetsp:Transcript_15464/g.39392  ORF Transcript_15464/g.39392 Transcript_15464/m.39392 type:complete len:232 (+) Transcript_15464:322-1017(+)
MDRFLFLRAQSWLTPLEPANEGKDLQDAIEMFNGIATFQVSLSENYSGNRAENGLKGLHAPDARRLRFESSKCGLHPENFKCSVLKYVEESLGDSGSPEMQSKVIIDFEGKRFLLETSAIRYAVSSSSSGSEDLQGDGEVNGDAPSPSKKRQRNRQKAFVSFLFEDVTLNLHDCSQHIVECLMDKKVAESAPKPGKGKVSLDKWGWLDRLDLALDAEAVDANALATISMSL